MDEQGNSHEFGLKERRCIVGDAINSNILYIMT